MSRRIQLTEEELLVNERMWAEEQLSKLLRPHVIAQTNDIMKRRKMIQDSERTVKRGDLIARIEAERSRQLGLPGSEMDVRNTPNDWASIASHYLTEEVRRGGYVPTREDFEDAFVKAAAVILAALEYAPTMQSMGHLRGEVSEEDVSSFRDALSKLADDSSRG